MPELFNPDSLYKLSFAWRSTGNDETVATEGYMDFDDIRVYELKDFKYDIKITDENGNPTGETTRAVNIYDGYVLKCKCGIENKLVQAETPETAAVYADRIIFKLAKRTYIEEMLHRLGL